MKIIDRTKKKRDLSRGCLFYNITVQPFDSCLGTALDICRKYSTKTSDPSKYDIERTPKN